MQGKKEKHYDWNVQPDAFLAAAYNLCQMAIDDPKNYNDKLIGSALFSFYPADSLHPNYEMCRVIIFNIKHAIELYFKSIGLINNNEIVVGHDIYKIIKDLESCFDVATNAILKALVLDLQGTIEKYFFGKYINGIPLEYDKNNTAERYPENKSYEVPDNYSWVTIEKVTNVQKDILFIQNRFHIAVKEIWDKRMIVHDY